MLAVDTADSVAAARGAAGGGEVVVCRRADRSVVTRSFATSPLRLLHPANHGHAAWVYQSSFGGGLVDGDDIRLAIEVGAGAAAYLSTQSSTKVYRSPRGIRSAAHGVVDRGGLLVVAPDPIVPFAGARFRQKQRYDLAADAGLVLVDVLASGRRAAGERWRFVEFESVLEVRIDDRVRVYDALSLRESDGNLARRCGRFDVIAVALVAGGSLQSEIARLTAGAPDSPGRNTDAVAAISRIDDVACLVKVAGTTTEIVGRTLRGMLDFVPSRLGDDPWSRKW